MTATESVSLSVCCQKVDVGAGPITVTQGREEAVDFTLPIYSFEAVGVRNKPAGSDDLQVPTRRCLSFQIHSPDTRRIQDFRQGAQSSFDPRGPEPKIYSK